MSNQRTLVVYLTALPLVCALGACSSDVIDLGGGNVAQNLEVGARCADSPVLDGDVTVTNQAELDALLGCEEIGGSLTVNVFEDTDVAPLESLRVVGGTLILGGYPELDNFDDEALEAYQVELARLNQIVEDGWLTTLHGVEALERVGSLTLLGIGAPDLTAFESLRSISAHNDGASAGSLLIANTRLEDLTGLEGVSGVRSIDIETSPALVSLDGLSVGATLDQVQLRDVPALADVSAFSEVENIQLLGLFWNTGLENMDDLSSLSSAGDLAFLSNERLVQVDALDTLEVATSVVFETNPSLTHVPQFQNLAGLDTFKALGNASLTNVSISVPNQFKANLVQGDFIELSIDVIEIGDNPLLGSLSIDSGVTSAQVLAVYSNAALSSINLGPLRRLDRLIISGNPALESVALGDLQTVDSIAVHENPGLSTAELRLVPTFEGAFSGNAD